MEDLCVASAPRRGSESAGPWDGGYPPRGGDARQARAVSVGRYKSRAAAPTSTAERHLTKLSPRWPWLSAWQVPDAAQALSACCGFLCEESQPCSRLFKTQSCAAIGWSYFRESRVSHALR